MEDSIFNEKLKHSLWLRILLFLVIILISSIIGIALSSILVFVGDTNMKLGQGISSIALFVVPPIVYYAITRKERPMQALGFRKLTPPWWLIIIGALLMFISLPVTNQLTVWNDRMDLGNSFAQLEDWMKALEESAEAATKTLLDVDTIGGLLFNLVVIALIPAIGEELTFRGVLQQSLTRGMKNPHIAIILSAAIFSFIHFQFYGFLPRMFLGILLGYMFYITNSLWTSMLMHFLNNGCAVLVYYLNNKGVINEDVEQFGAASSIWIVAASLMITVGLIAWSWERTEKA